jgi:hypothetical protein
MVRPVKMSKIRLHGCIVLDVPDGMGEYEAWQQLEELLRQRSGGCGDDLGRGVSVADFFLARCIGDNVDQKTQSYEEWPKEVASE